MFPQHPALTMFRLDTRLADDTIDLGRLTLSQVLLMNDRAVPWLILVPRRSDISELYELDRRDRHRLMDEVTEAERVLRRLYRPDKLNVGALGNQVGQLHVHVIARFELDRAWPGPIWGTGPVTPYAGDEREVLAGRLRKALKTR